MCEKKTMEQLEIIRKEREAEEQVKREEWNRRYLSIKLDICPECGCPIVREDVEILDKPVTIFGFPIKRKKIWSKRRICSKDKSHFEEKEQYGGYSYEGYS